MGSLLLLGWLSAVPAFALNPRKAITQFIHTAWTEQQGAPDNIRALAQTSDGYLWLGTGDGLFHFDGVRFVRFEAPAGQQLPSVSVRTLLPTPDGALWIVFLSGEVSRLRHGRLTSYTKRQGLHPALGLAESGDGTLIAATEGGLEKLENEVWTDVGREWGLPGEMAKEIYFDKQSVLWVVAADRMVYLPPGAKRFVDPDEPIRFQYPSAYSFSQSPDGVTWLAETSRSAHALAMSSVRDRLAEVRVGARSILFDRDGSLWIGSLGDGLRRVAFPNRAGVREIAQFGPEAEQYGLTDGLSGNHVLSALEDREGNIWFGTARGLDRFRDASFTPVSIPARDVPRAISPARDGSVWSFAASRSDVERVNSGTYSTLATGRGSFVRSVYEDETGVLWVAIDKGLMRLEGSQLVPVPLPEGKVLTEVWAMTKDRAGGLWLPDPNAGLFRLIDGKVTTISEKTAPVSPFACLLSDRSGRVWIAGGGKISYYQDGELHSLESQEGVPSGALYVLYQDRAGNIWAGGEGGLAKFDNGRFRKLSNPTAFPARSVIGIAQDDNGDWWMATESGVLQISGSELERAFADRGHRARYRLFDVLDGLPARPRQRPPLPVVAPGVDGRIWFATAYGLAFVDPHSMPKNSLPPPVLIVTAKIDGKSSLPINGVSLSSHTREIEIDYTANSLSIPERVLFRYKLEGSNSDWQDAGTRRQAFYGHLPPKHYRFRVIACNNDGVWNDAGASWDFDVTPAFYQKTWFQLVLGLAGARLVWLLYQYRLRQVTATVRLRYSERLAERTRIAGELHDTLLQTIQAAKMVADHARQEYSADADRLRESVNSISGWLARATDEGRSALNAMRVAIIAENDLAEAFQRAAETFRGASQMRFVLTVEGPAKALHPVVRDEICRIGIEAIRNAYIHSGASRLQVNLRYSHKLTISVRDNGRGMDPDVAKRGRPGHFGLCGMAERADRVRAVLSVTSRPGAGTEVELTIDGKIAFRDPANRRLPWLGRALASLTVARRKDKSDAGEKMHSDS